MSILQYRWRLKIGSGAYADCYPRWGGEETSIINEGQDDEMFYREKLNAKLTFQRSDFDLIEAADFDTEFRVLLQRNDAGSWVSLNVARFWKTDCTFDVDNKTVTVSPQTFDIYEKVLEGLEKEFNLIELAPPIISVNYLKQSLFQIYLSGASFVANYSNEGVFFELPCTPFGTWGSTADHNELLANGFGLGALPGGALDWVRIVIPGSGLTPDVSGIYRPFFYDGFGLPSLSDNATLTFRRLDDEYAITIDNTQPPGQVRYLITSVEHPTYTTFYESDAHADPWTPFGQPPHSTPNLVFTSVTNPSSQVEAYMFMPYVRLLTNLTSVNGDPTGELDDTDPIPHGDYTHALAVDTLNFEYSAESSTTPTRWGKFSGDALHFGGEYFVIPSISETLMPILSTTWTGASAWFYFDTELNDLQQAASEPITIKDCYKLSDVINSLLTEIGATCDHQDDSTYSDFLYAATNSIRGSRRVLAITQKSNVLIGEYDQPAQKAPIRLREVLDFLKIFLRAYWYIEESKFVIEHRHFFDNGKSYSTAGVGVDLTTSLEPRTGLPWSYRTSNYSYDKAKLPERLEFRWMDNVSKPFEGYPIQVNSAYVNRGAVEQKQITKFTSDIDFFNVAASDISKEGFVVFDCTEDGDELDVPFLEVTVSADEVYKLQNGYLSFVYGHPTYHMHGLPATDVNMNRADVTATSTIRTKNQELQIAVGSEIDPYELITSNLGNGKIERMEQNLSSQSLKIKIKLETE